MDRRYDPDYPDAETTGGVPTPANVRTTADDGTTPGVRTTERPAVTPADRVEDDRVRVANDRVVVEDRYDPIREAKDRFGGVDLPASLSGMLVGLAMLLILAGLASAAFGEIAFQTGTTGNEAELSLGALITAGVVLFVSFLIGGWAAGRMARYSGAVNGLMVAVWFVVLVGVLAGLGAVAGDAYNLFDNLQVAKANLPDWFSADTVTTGAIISAIAFVVVMFLGSIVGAIWGQRLHRRADALLVSRNEADESRIVRDNA